ncbi:MAG: restriction endonuclease subunit S [Treponema sp.]|nr:restriction endonuclease subunit S [Spirochaetales bacterium]MDY6189536.1 restriction endonuclease subunit S [Treponema sp.]
MNTKALRQKVLDLAIHGKLVPQNPNDESATVLLEKIRAEKAEKIKKGELKADKKDSFIFVGSDKRHYEQFVDGTVKDIEDEIPFDVPKEWAWCRLGELFYHTTGKALKKSNNKGSLRKYITTSNLYWNKFDFTEVREMYFTNDELDKCTIKKGDLVLCNGGDVGRAAIWNFDEDICYQNHVSRLRPKIIGINNKLYLYLLMFYKEQGMLNGKGVGITSLSANDLLSGLFPLPPINEQDQIVIKIENIFSQIDYIDDNKSDLQTAINKTKSKILDLVIHGKLVPQDPNDEPAEELLKRISTSDNRPYKKFEEDEVPFIIPFNWKWERLAKISSIISKGTTPRGGKNAYCIEGINYLRVENISADGTINLEDINHISENEHLTFLKRSILQENDVIISIAGTLGKIGIIRKCDLPMNTNQAIAFVRISNLSIINLKYLRYVLESVELQRLLLSQTKVTSIPNLTLEIINNCPIPLPPIQEQNRIVSKIEELFSDLDSISSNLE